MLSLIDVSQDFLDDGVASYQDIGDSIQSVSDWAFLLSLPVFALGALMLNTVLYESRLVPRFISVWGLVAAVVLLIGALLRGRRGSGQGPGRRGLRLRSHVQAFRQASGNSARTVHSGWGCRRVGGQAG